MKQTNKDLHDISSGTLADYQNNAEGFRQGTWNHDVSQNIEALLRYIKSPAPYCLLDFGCGPGRDLITLSQLGHVAIGLDGTENFVAMAKAASNCEVWLQDFLQLDLPQQKFDGIFANASLQHIPSQELPRVLRQLHHALKPEGVLFYSIPRGDNSEGWNRHRYAAYHDTATWFIYLQQAGFIELEHYYRPPGLPREQQPWLAGVCRRSA